MSEGRREQAVAVRYDSERDSAPRLVAKGRGELAERILEIARENGIPIRHDPDLLEALAAVNLGDQIPEKLFQAVAEILAYVYRVGKTSQRVKETKSS